jgi:hypothetical protein
MKQPGERWSIEVHGVLGWSTDTSGRIYYDTRDAALEWARKLRSIHPRVRLRHEVTDYEEVEPK